MPEKLAGKFGEEEKPFIPESSGADGKAKKSKYPRRISTPGPL